jgi:hypothetical protein
MPQQERKRRLKTQVKDKECINDRDREMVDRAVSEITCRAAADDKDEVRASPSTGRHGTLQNMKISDEYATLIETHARAYLRYQKDDSAGNIVAMMYREIRKHHPDMRILDVVAKILLDTRKHWVMKTMMDSLCDDGIEEGNEGRSGSRKGRRLQSSVAAKREEEGQTTSLSHHQSGIVLRVFRLDREEFHDELLDFLGGKLVGKRYLYILAKEEEVMAVSPYRDELDRIMEGYISR